MVTVDSRSDAGYLQARMENWVGRVKRAGCSLHTSPSRLRWKVFSFHRCGKPIFSCDPQHRYSESKSKNCNTSTKDSICSALRDCCSRRSSCWASSRSMKVVRACAVSGGVPAAREDSRAMRQKCSLTRIPAMGATPVPEAIEPCQARKISAGASSRNESGRFRAFVLGTPSVSTCFQPSSCTAIARITSGSKAGKSGPLMLRAISPAKAA